MIWWDVSLGNKTYERKLRQLTPDIIFSEDLPRP
jgi:hypothetical protein